MYFSLTANIVVAVSALPVGIIGNGFEDEIEKRRSQEKAGPVEEES